MLPKSIYRGVSWFKPANRWRARVSVGPKGAAKEVSLGYFHDELEAAEAVASYRAQQPAYGRDLSKSLIQCLGPCGLEKSQDDFYNSYTRRDGSQGKNNWCKVCCRTAQRANYRARADHHKAVAADWRRRNAELARSYRTDRKARIRGAWVENVDRGIVYRMHGGRCGICGEFIAGEFHVDHVHPLSRGGEHSYANAQPSHPACNMRKQAHLMAELAQIAA